MNDDLVDSALFWLVWVPAGLALAVVYLMLGWPLLLVYGATRLVAGQRSAERIATAVLVAFVLVVGAVTLLVILEQPLAWWVRWTWPPYPTMPQ